MHHSRYALALHRIRDTRNRRRSTMLLSDVLIIDATDRLGWLARRLLADLGADVIKLEPPRTHRSPADLRAFHVNKRVFELHPRTPAERTPVAGLLAPADNFLL